MLSLLAFRSAVASVMYAILSIMSSQRLQMADVGTKGILYKITACLELVCSE